MTQEDYEQKKRECWEEYKRENLDGEVQWQPVSRYDVFCAAFDRAYALGKHFGNSEQLSMEGDEILTVPREDVVELYQEVQKTIDKYQCTHLGNEAVGKREVLRHLFGSKCLPDEPLFQIPAENCNSGNHIPKSDNKPTEPTENANLSQETANCDKRFDNILKDSFSKERRLNIAAMAMQGILANSDEVYRAETCTEAKQTPQAIAKYALACADALIAECEASSSAKNGVNYDHR